MEQFVLWSLGSKTCNSVRHVRIWVSRGNQQVSIFSTVILSGTNRWEAGVTESSVKAEVKKSLTRVALLPQTYHIQREREREADCWKATMATAVMHEPVSREGKTKEGPTVMDLENRLSEEVLRKLKLVRLSSKGPIQFCWKASAWFVLNRAQLVVWGFRRIRQPGGDGSCGFLVVSV